MNTPTPRTSAGVAWIAGVGPQAGLGAALGRRFAAAGLTVALTGRNTGRLQQVAAQICAGGGRAVALPGDVTRAAELRDIATQVQRLGRLDAAIYNAGNAVRATPLELTPEDFEATWRVAAFGGFLFAQVALPLLLEHGGSLLFTGATASLRGRGPFTAFAAAKAALRSLAQSCAREYGPQGVHVAHVIIDGGIDGERLRSHSPQRVAQAAEDGLLKPEAIAETYWQLHAQSRSAWTHELDLRPFSESF